jgi:hypothetical protein
MPDRRLLTRRAFLGESVAHKRAAAGGGCGSGAARAGATPRTQMKQQVMVYMWKRADGWGLGQMLGVQQREEGGGRGALRLVHDGCVKKGVSGQNTWRVETKVVRRHRRPRAQSG